MIKTIFLSLLYFSYYSIEKGYASIILLLLLKRMTSLFSETFLCIVTDTFSEFN